MTDVEPADKPTEESKSPSLAVKIIGPLVAVCCAGWGLALGLYFWAPDVSRVAVAPAPTMTDIPQDTSVVIDGDVSRPTVANARLGAEDRIVSVRQLHLIDVMLTHGDVAHALESYSHMVPKKGTVLHDQLMYRMCLAREILGQYEAAHEMYSSMMSRTTEPTLYVAARLGQARVALRKGEISDAREILARTLLDSTTIIPQQSPVHGELAHLHAMSHLEFSTFDSKTMLDENQTITLLPEWRPGKLLELAQSTNDESAPSEDEGGEEKLLAAPRDVVEVIYRYGQHPAEVQITAELSEASVLDVVARLAKAAELQVTWTGGATASVKRRSLAFNSMPVTLAVALDRVLDIFGLTWSVSDDQLTISMLIEHTEDELVELNREVSGRLLRHAIATHTEHPLSVYGYMALGNLAFEQQAYSGAISVYDQFEEKYPRAPDLVVVQYNRGKAYLKEQQREAAILSFFQSADGGHGHPLQSSANVFAGELLLEDGKIADAPRALIRAVSSATTPEHKARPILSLAAAYLLADNAHAAVQVLMEGREALKAREDMRHLAAFANSYAQFKVAKDQLDVLRAGRNLVDTLSDLPEVGDLGDYWHLLIGAAFRDVGLSSQMVAVYQSALEKTSSKWVSTEIGEQLVGYWKLNGDHEAMRTWLLEHQSSVQSSLRLAEVSLRGGRYAECRTTCRELLKNEADSEQKQQALRLLGLAYKGEGEHYKAALCFAGMLPGEQPGGSPEPTTASPATAGGDQNTNPDTQQTSQ